MSALPPPDGPSPWPSLPPPVIIQPAGRAVDEDEWARNGAPFNHTSPPITVQPATEVIGEAVPRAVPSPTAHAEVGPVVVERVANESASRDAAARSRRGTAARHAPRPITRRPLFIAAVIAGVLALIAVFASLRHNSSNDGGQTANSATTTAAPSGPSTSTVTTAATTTASTAASTSAVPATTESLPSSSAATAAPTSGAPATTGAPPTTGAASTTASTTASAEIPPPVVYDGRFNKTFKVTMPESAGQIIVYVTHNGPRTFIVRPLDRNGQPLATLVNHNGAGQGPFTGSFLVNQFSSLQVIADGTWHAELRSVLSGRPFASSIIGTGPEVLIYTGVAGSAAITHDGRQEFRIEARTADGTVDQLVKTPGAFEGSVPIPAGFALIVVSADGNWSITVSS